MSKIIIASFIVEEDQLLEGTGTDNISIRYKEE